MHSPFINFFFLLFIPLVVCLAWSMLTLVYGNSLEELNTAGELALDSVHTPQPCTMIFLYSFYLGKLSALTTQSSHRSGVPVICNGDGAASPLH